MAKTTIAWADYTFNPWIGCQKVAAGCENCYAEAYARRYNRAAWGPNGTRVKTGAAYWKNPLAWERQAASDAERFEVGITFVEPRRPRVFCASLADVFEDWDGPVTNANGIAIRNDRGQPRTDGLGDRLWTMADVRRDLFALIDQTPHLDWLLLTKRPENVRRMWPVANPQQDTDRIDFRHNVWLGTSVSDQATADRNAPLLLRCRDLAPVLFLSCEPLLAPIDLRSDAIQDAIGAERDICGYPQIDWVIAGGESGPHHRHMTIAWARSLRDQCRAAAIPFFFKQHSGQRPGDVPELEGQIIQEFPGAQKA